MPAIPVLRFTQLHNGQPIDLYIGTAQAREIVRRYKIDTFHQFRNPGGYQRALQSTRVLPIARYVLKGEGMLPTALLANIRSGGTFEPIATDTPTSTGGGGAFGLLHFPDDEPWWIMDGQHRSSGIAEAIERLAASRTPRDLDYAVPVTFCLNLSRSAEAEVFQIVNSKARSVPTDLVAEMVTRRAIEGRRGDEPARLSVNALRKAAGVKVAHYLDASSGPWKGRIQQVNEPKDAVTKPMSINTFASTLRTFLRDRWAETRFLRDPKDPEFTDLGQLVLAYWKALESLMPEAFADIAHYAVQRPIGVYVFHELLPDVAEYCRVNADWSQKSFTKQLSRLQEWVDSETWHRERGADIVKGSANRAAINVILDRMRLLYRDPLAGLPGD